MQLNLKYTLLLMIFVCELKAQTFNLNSVDFKANDILRAYNIQFEYNKGVIFGKCYKTLDSVVDFLNIHPNIVLEVGMHNDFRGGNSYSRRLTVTRSKAIADYFISKGISPIRLTSVGYEHSEPIITEAQILSMTSKKNQEKSHQINRRVEFKILKLDPLNRIVYKSFKDSLFNIGDRILMDYDFSYYYAELSKGESNKNAIAELSKLLLRFPNLRIALVTYTDQRGDAEYNLKLSQQRASSIKQILTEQYKIPEERIFPFGFGESRPLVSEEKIKHLPTEEEREVAYKKNRRTEIFCLSAKEITVSGYVVCAEDTSCKIAYAKVILKGSDNSMFEKICDSLGFYSLDLKNGVTYVISVTSDKKYKNELGGEKLLFYSSDKRIMELEKLQFKNDIKLNFSLDRVRISNCFQFIFYYNENTIEANNIDIIDSFVQFLKDNLNNEYKLELTAYIKSTENVRVGKKRMKLLKKHLIEKGIDENKILFNKDIIVKPYTRSELTCDGEKLISDQPEKNARIEFKFIKPEQ